MIVKFLMLAMFSQGNRLLPERKEFFGDLNPLLFNGQDLNQQSILNNPLLLNELADKDWGRAYLSTHLTDQGYDIPMAMLLDGDSEDYYLYHIANSLNNPPAAAASTPARTMSDALKYSMMSGQSGTSDFSPLAFGDGVDEDVMQMAMLQGKDIPYWALGEDGQKFQYAKENGIHPAIANKLDDLKDLWMYNDLIKKGNKMGAQALLMDGDLEDIYMYSNAASNGASNGASNQQSNGRQAVRKNIMEDLQLYMMMPGVVGADGNIDINAVMRYYPGLVQKLMDDDMGRQIWAASQMNGGKISKSQLSMLFMMEQTNLRGSRKMSDYLKYGMMTGQTGHPVSPYMYGDNEDFAKMQYAKENNIPLYAAQKADGIEDLMMWAQSSKPGQNGFMYGADEDFQLMKIAHDNNLSPYLAKQFDGVPELMAYINAKKGGNQQMANYYLMDGDTEDAMAFQQFHHQPIVNPKMHHPHIHKHRPAVRGMSDVVKMQLLSGQTGAGTGFPLGMGMDGEMDFEAEDAWKMDFADKNNIPYWVMDEVDGKKDMMRLQYALDNGMDLYTALNLDEDAFYMLQAQHSNSANNEDTPSTESTPTRGMSDYLKYGALTGQNGASPYMYGDSEDMARYQYAKDNNIPLYAAKKADGIEDLMMWAQSSKPGQSGFMFGADEDMQVLKIAHENNISPYLAEKFDGVPELMMYINAKKNGNGQIPYYLMGDSEDALLYHYMNNQPAQKTDNTEENQSAEPTPTRGMSDYLKYGMMTGQTGHPASPYMYGDNEDFAQMQYAKENNIPYYAAKKADGIEDLMMWTQSSKPGQNGFMYGADEEMQVLKIAHDNNISPYLAEKFDGVPELMAYINAKKNGNGQIPYYLMGDSEDALLYHYMNNKPAQNTNTHGRGSIYEDAAKYGMLSGLGQTGGSQTSGLTNLALMDGDLEDFMQLGLLDHVNGMTHTDFASAAGQAAMYDMDLKDAIIMNAAQAGTVNPTQLLALDGDYAEDYVGNQYSLTNQLPLGIIEDAEDMRKYETAIRFNLPLTTFFDTDKAMMLMAAKQAADAKATTDTKPAPNRGMSDYLKYGMMTGQTGHPASPYMYGDNEDFAQMQYAKENNIPYYAAKKADGIEDLMMWAQSSKPGQNGFMYGADEEMQVLKIAHDNNISPYLAEKFDGVPELMAYINAKKNGNGQIPYYLMGDSEDALLYHYMNNKPAQNTNTGNGHARGGIKFNPFMMGMYGNMGMGNMGMGYGNMGMGNMFGSLPPALHQQAMSWMMTNPECIGESDMSDCYKDMNQMMMMYGMMAAHQNQQQQQQGRPQQPQSSPQSGPRRNLQAGLMDNDLIDSDMLQYQAFKSMAEANGQVDPLLVGQLLDGKYAKWAAIDQMTKQGMSPVVAAELADSKYAKMQALEKMEAQPGFDALIADKALDGDFLEIKCFQQLLKSGINVKAAKDIADHDYIQYKYLETLEQDGVPNTFIAREVLDGDYLEFKAIDALIKKGVAAKVADEMVDENENLELEQLDQLVKRGIVTIHLLSALLENDYLKYQGMQALLNQGTSETAAADLGQAAADVQQQNQTETARMFVDIATEVLGNPETNARTRRSEMSPGAMAAFSSMTGNNMFSPWMMAQMTDGDLFDMENGFPALSAIMMGANKPSTMGGNANSAMMNLNPYMNPYGSMMMTDDARDQMLKNLKYGGYMNSMFHPYGQQGAAGQNPGTQGTAGQNPRGKANFEVDFEDLAFLQPNAKGRYPMTEDMFDNMMKAKAYGILSGDKTASNYSPYLFAKYADIDLEDMLPSLMTAPATPRSSIDYEDMAKYGMLSGSGQAGQNSALANAALLDADVEDIAMAQALSGGNIDPSLFAYDEDFAKLGVLGNVAGMTSGDLTNIASKAALYDMDVKDAIFSHLATSGTIDPMQLLTLGGDLEDYTGNQYSLQNGLPIGILEDPEDIREYETALKYKLPLTTFFDADKAMMLIAAKNAATAKAASETPETPTRGMSDVYKYGLMTGQQGSQIPYYGGDSEDMMKYNFAKQNNISPLLMDKLDDLKDMQLYLHYRDNQGASGSSIPYGILEDGEDMAKYQFAKTHNIPFYALFDSEDAFLLQQLSTSTGASTNTDSETPVRGAPVPQSSKPRYYFGGGDYEDMMKNQYASQLGLPYGLDLDVPDMFKYGGFNNNNNVQGQSNPGQLNPGQFNPAFYDEDMWKFGGLFGNNAQTNPTQSNTPKSNLPYFGGDYEDQMEMNYKHQNGIPLWLDSEDIPMWHYYQNNQPTTDPNLQRLRQVLEASESQ